MNKTRLTVSVLAIVLGVVLFVYGGMDDSPGAQLIGVVIAIAGIVGAIKSRRKAPMMPQQPAGQSMPSDTGSI